MKAHPEYLKFCRNKAFLLSKAVDPAKGHESLALISKTKQNLEIKYGAKMGFGESQRVLEEAGFIDCTPLGAGAIVQNEELCLHHDDFQHDDWVRAYKNYSARTKYGTLIMAVTTKNFMFWATSDACRKEVKNIASGRLFVYIEHDDDDEGGRGGYIVSVDPLEDEGFATVGCGQGYVLYSNGSYYHGPLKNGVPHTEGDSEGIYTYVSGAIYQGGWKEDKYHGEGEKAWADGQVYKGSWKGSQSHGYGICTYASGAVYDGYWKDNQYHGKGKYTCEEGSVYDGEFEHGEFHGKGKKASPLWFGFRTVQDGVWENGKFVGS